MVGFPESKHERVPRTCVVEVLLAIRNHVRAAAHITYTFVSRNLEDCNMAAPVLRRDGEKNKE
jgi:hypothetical protein